MADADDFSTTPRGFGAAEQLTDIYLRLMAYERVVTELVDAVDHLNPDLLETARRNARLHYQSSRDRPEGDPTQARRLRQSCALRLWLLETPQERERLRRRPEADEPR